MWEPPDHLPARLYYTVFRCLNASQQWVWKGMIPSPPQAVFVMSLLQMLNLMTISRLVDWPTIPLARTPARVFALAIILGPCALNWYLLLRKGRAPQILRRAELYDHLSMGWGDALTVAYALGTFIVLAWSFGASLPI